MDGLGNTGGEDVAGLFDAAFAGAFAEFVGGAWRLAGAPFINLAIAVVVDAIAEVVVGAGWCAFSPAGSIAEVGLAAAEAELAGRFAIARREPGAVRCVSVPCFVRVSTVVKFALEVEAFVVARCGGTARRGQRAGVFCRLGTKYTRATGFGSIDSSVAVVVFAVAFGFGELGACAIV